MTPLKVALCFVVLALMPACSGDSNSDSLVTVTYPVERACELLVPALCEKGAACGAVIDASTDPQACLECSPAVVALLVPRCVEALPREPDAADVDGCASALRSSTCDQICNSDAVPLGCEAFSDSLFDDAEGIPTSCAAACVAG